MLVWVSFVSVPLVCVSFAYCAPWPLSAVPPEFTRICTVPSLRRWMISLKKAIRSFHLVPVGRVRLNGGHSHGGAAVAALLLMAQNRPGFGRCASIPSRVVYRNRNLVLDLFLRCHDYPRLQLVVPVEESTPVPQNNLVGEPIAKLFPATVSETIIIVVHRPVRRRVVFASLVVVAVVVAVDIFSTNNFIFFLYVRQNKFVEHCVARMREDGRALAKTDIVHRRTFDDHDGSSVVIVPLHLFLFFYVLSRFDPLIVVLRFDFPGIREGQQLNGNPVRHQ